MRALLVDDEELVLDGLGAYLQLAWPELVLDQARDMASATELAAAVRHELVLLDWCMAGADGQPGDVAAFIQALRQRPGGAPAIVLVSGADPDLCAQQVRQLGLAGHVPKSAGGPALLQAMRTALAGGVYRPDGPLLARARATARRPDAAARPEPQQLRQRFPELTERQSQVLAILACGASDKQIARELGLSLNTVRSHVRMVLAVLGVQRRGEAAHAAVLGPRT